MASNKDYGAAAKGPKNVAAQPGTAKMKDAVKTSRGADAKPVSGSENNSSFKAKERGRPSNHGLDTAKSAWIHSSGSGYPTSHVRGGKIPQTLSNPGSLTGNSTLNHGMVDYTHGKNGNDNSIQRLQSKKKLDRMF